MRWKKKYGHIEGCKGEYPVCALYPISGGYQVGFFLPGLEDSREPNSLKEAKKFAEDQVGTWFRNIALDTIKEIQQKIRVIK